MLTIHERALQIASQYRKLERDLLFVLEEVKNANVFLEQGCSSLFEYMVKVLSLSEATAYSIQTLLRKAVEVPELKILVASGELTLCKARRIAPVITPKSAQAWIAFAKSATTKQIDHQVAATRPECVSERITPKSQTRSELKIGISLKFEEKLARLQDLVSNDRRKNVSKEEALEAAMDAFLETFSARRKVRVKNSNTNKTLTPNTKQLVLERDGDQCTHRNPKGPRCRNRRFLDIHHVKPRAQGGDHHQENLTTLCSTHHRWIHRQSI